MGRGPLHGLIVAVAALVLTPPLAQAGPIYSGANFGIEVVAGPAVFTGFNGNSVSFRSAANDLHWTPARTDPSPMQLHEQYDVKLTANPGWAFSSINLFAFGQMDVGNATALGGPVGYTIGNASSVPISSGLLRTCFMPCPASGTYLDYYWQNQFWGFYTGFIFNSGTLPVPASSFTLSLTTDIYVQAYIPAGFGGYGMIGMHGDNYFSPGTTWGLDATVTPAPVPVPNTLVLLATGAAGLFARFRHGKHAIGV